MADAQDIINEVLAKKASALQPRPTTPAFQPQRLNLKPIPVPSAIRAPKPTETKDRGILGGIFKSATDIAKFPVSFATMVPTLVGKAAQSAVGAGETLFDIGADIINPNLYKSRSEVDYEKGKALGLEGSDLLAYSMQRTMPLFAPIVSSVPQTAARLAETATLGAADFGKPGFDYYQALRSGELGNVLLEDVGNIMLLKGGAGKLSPRGVAAPTRLGRTAQVVGEFADNPIAATLRATSRGVARPKVAGQFPRLAEAAGRVAESATPLRGVYNEAIGAKRAWAVSLGAETQRKINALETEMPGASPLRKEQIAVELKPLIEKRNNYLKASGIPKEARKAVDEMTRKGENLRTQIVSVFTRFKDLGAIPETIEFLRNQEQTLRKDAQAAQDAGETSRANNLLAHADLVKQKVEVKESDTAGELSGPAPVWVAPASTLVSTGQMPGILIDVANGLPLEEILKRVTPQQVAPDLAGMGGYGYTVEALAKAIDYAQGRLSPTERIQIDIYNQILQNWHQFWWDQAMARRGFTTSTVPYTYAFTSPDPRNLLLFLEQGTTSDALRAKLNVALDEYFARYLEQVAPGLAAELEIDLANLPNGTWQKFAEETIGSPAYDIAYQILQLAFDDLRANPDFARIMQEPMIYPAAMKPAMFNEKTRLKIALGDDVAGMADGLERLIETHQDLLSPKTIASIQRIIEKARGPETQFDRSTFMGLERRLASIAKMVSERIAKLDEQQGKLTQRQTGVDDKLANVIQTISDIQYFIQRLTDNPEAVLGDTAKLTSARTAEQANLSRIDSIPDEMAQVDAEIKADIQQQKEANAYLQQEADNIQGELEEARRVAQEADDNQTALQQQYDELQAYLENFNALTPEELNALQTDFEIALEIHSKYASGKNFVSRGQAEAAKRISVERATQRARDAQGRVELLLPSRMRRERTEAIGLGDDPTAMSFMQEDFRQPFESAVYQIIGDPKLAKKAVKDFVDTKTVVDEGRAVDQLNMESGRDFESDSAYMEELGRAWAEQWVAEKELGRAKQRGVEAIRKEMADESQASIDDAIEASRSVTKQPLPWVERMIELSDRATLNEQTKQLQNLRRDLTRAESAAKQAQTKLNRLSEQSLKVNEKLRPKINSELATRRIRLEKEKKSTSKAVPRLRKAVEAATRQQEKSQATRVRARLKGIATVQPEATTIETLDNQGRPVKITGPTPNAGQPVLNKTVKAKLTDQQEQALNETVNITNKIADVRQQLLETAPLEEGTAALQAESATQQQAQLARPTGPQLVQQPPVYFPGGQTAGTTERSAIPLTMRSEGISPEVKAKYENLRTTNVMATSAGQQGGKLNEVLGQFARNVTVQDFIINPEFVLPIGDVIGLEVLAQLQKSAEDALRAQNIPRTPSEFASVLKYELGTLIMRELKSHGYEPVSPVKFDPEIAERDPVGGLTEIVLPESIDANTIAMRIGLRDTIASRFEEVHGNTIPEPVRKVFAKVGKYTTGWKSVILPFSVRWQIGDLVGNVMNAWIRGDIPVNQLVRAMNDVKNRITVGENGLIRTLKSDVANESMTDPALAALVGAGLEARGLRAAELKAIQEGTLKPLVEAEPVRMFPKFRKKAFNVNATQNLIARAAVAMVKLEESLAAKGRTIDEIDPITIVNDPALRESVIDAVRQTNETLGAFSEMSPWERNVFRQVFPFWSWIKFINKAAGQLVLDQPDRVLFYGHLGSMYAGGDGKDMLDWLKGKTPTPFGMMDFRFLNPYSDAMLFNPNPIEAFSQQFTRPSPVIQTLGDVVNLVGYYRTGKNIVPFSQISRPSYLEGRPGTSTRGVGDFLGELGYMGLTRFGGPFRNILGVLPNEIPVIAPEGRLLGTDVAIGAVNRYPQGSARTKGIYAEPRLGPIGSRVGALLSAFGIPAPVMTMEKALAQSETQAAKDEKARLSRIVNRLQSRQ